MADAGSGLGDHPKLNLTAEEKRIYGLLYKQADTTNAGVVTGELAITLFPRSKLDEHTLGSIWAMADTENRGFLLQEDFAKALRWIGHYQARPGRELTPELALQPAPPGYPKFEGLNMAPGMRFDQSTGPSPIAAQTSGSIRVPPLTPDKIADYTQMFERAGAKNGILAGDVARTFFERSGLPNEILAHVWNLADTQQRSALSPPEFIIAMHLLSSFKTGTLTALPQTLPAGLMDAASRKPSMPPQATGYQAGIPRQFSGASAGRSGSPLVRQPFGAPSAPDPNAWLVSDDEKKGFDVLFDRLDRDNGGLGYMTGDQAFEFFSQSNLPTEDLATIWDLSNIQGTDTLNRDEFAVAMYLIKNQRGKKGDLPKQIPPNLVPPSLRRQTYAPQPPGQNQAQPPVQPAAPKPSASEDLFGLDALSSPPVATPSVPQQTTGGSTSFSRPLDKDPFGTSSSSPTAPTFAPSPRDTSSQFKRFVPTSSWGQGLNAQTTGGSGTSSTVQSREQRPANNPMDDLLGDNDPEVSKKLTADSAELGNMSNQMGTLTNQMRDLQSKKTATQSDLNSINTQKRELENRLTQFRSHYEQEFKVVKALEDQLSTSQKENRQLHQELSSLETDYQALQGQHRQIASALENDRRESSGLKDRMRQINAETAQLRPQLEKMRNEARHEKGLVTINKKQLEKSETERDSMRAEMTDLTRAAQESSRSVEASPAPSGGSSTNPFFRKGPQQSFDNTMSPGGFAPRIPSKESNNFDNLFGPSFTSTPASSSQAPAPGFRSDTFPPQSERSMTSSDTGAPTPSASPRPTEPPAPPASRQITSRDLPLQGPQGGESVATSVRVETPTSRYGGTDTPTNASGSSPAPQGFDRPEPNRSDTTTSTGAAMFDRNLNASPTTSDTSSRQKQGDKNDFFRSFGNTIPGAFPEPTPLQTSTTGDSRSDPFSFPAQPSRTATNKSDFDQAFNSKQPQARQVTGSSTNGSIDDPSVHKFKSEFPPIALNEDDDSDSEPGFEDDFTQASPAHQRQTSQSQSRPSKDVPSNSFFGNQPPASDLPTPGAQRSPPAYEQSAGGPSSGARGSNDFPPEFGGLLPSRENPMSPQSQGSQSPERSFASPASGGQGQVLFGGPSTSKSTSTAPTTQFSGSPPPTTSTPVSTVPSDAYHSAPSYPSGSTDKSVNASQHSSSHRSAPVAGDDFDAGFDDLTDAKEDDDRGDDDFMFGSQHHEFDEFNPAFDSPAMSKSGTMASERTPTAAGQSSGFDSSFGDFESTFSSKAPQLPPPKSSGQDDWDAMMKSVEKPGTADNSKAFGENSNLFGDSDFSAPPEAPEPPKLARTETQGTEHDVQDLKKLMKLGYPRRLALEKLEQYDYDFDKALESLSR